MAGFIKLEIDSKVRTWKTANWVFNAFLEHVTSIASNQTDLVDEVTICKYHQIADLVDIAKANTDLSKRFVAAILQAAADITDGKFSIKIEDRELTDEKSRWQYQQAILELRQLLGPQ